MSNTDLAHLHCHGLPGCYYFAVFWQCLIIWVDTWSFTATAWPQTQLPSFGECITVSIFWSPTVLTGSFCCPTHHYWKQWYHEGTNRRKLWERWRTQEIDTPGGVSFPVDSVGSFLRIRVALGRADSRVFTPFFNKYVFKGNISNGYSIK